MTLLTRLLALILIAVLPSIAILLYNEQVLRAAREEALRQEALMYAQAAADELERVVEGARGFLFAVAQAPPIRREDWPDCSRYMSRLADIQPAYARLAVVDAAGGVTCASGPDVSGMPIAERPHFKEALSGGDFAVGGLLTGQSDAGILPLAAALHREDGTIGGVLLAGLRIDWLVQQLERKQQPADRTLLVADRDGTILARSPDPERWLGQRIDPAWEAYARGDSAGTVIETDADGVRRVYGYVPPAASLAQLFVVDGISAAQGLGQIEAASRRGVALVVAAGLCALIATWLVGDRLIRQPIRRLVEYAHDLGMGRYDRTVRREAGEFSALTEAFADAARKLAARESELRASETRFHRLAELTREGVAIHDGEQVIEANNVAAAIFGYAPDEVVGRPVLGFVAPEARAEARTNMLAGKEEPYESIGLRKDGSRFPIEVYAHGIDYEGRPARVIAVRDLTASKKSEEALRLAEERYRLAARATRDLIWDWDIRRFRVQFNESICMAFGYAEHEMDVPFQWWVDRLHADDRDRVMTSLWAAVESPDLSWQSEYRLRRADGSWADVLDRGIFVRAPDGQAERMIGAVIDLTQRKRTEVALRGAAERNQALLREADHRIKNNLQLVSSMLGLQRASLQDAVARQAFQDARLRIQAIARVHQALYSAGNFERADFGEVLGTLRDSLRSDARDPPTIIVEAPPGSLVRAAKATPLALIANELITNALKHGFPAGRHGTVTARCAREGGDLVLTVADDGIGLPPDFDLTANAGFGLRLVRTLATQIGAQIAVQSGGPGTKIEVRVPAAAG